MALAGGYGVSIYGMEYADLLARNKIGIGVTSPGHVPCYGYDGWSPIGWWTAGRSFPGCPSGLRPSVPGGASGTSSPRAGSYARARLWVVSTASSSTRSPTPGF